MSEAKKAAKSVWEGNRKLIVTAVAYGVTMAIGTIMAATGDLPSAEWVDLAKWVTLGAVGGFGVGNGLEHIGKKA